MPYSSEAEYLGGGSVASKISRDYNFPLVANIVVPMSVSGSTLYLKEATSDVIITIYPSGRSVTLKKGQGEDVGAYENVRITSALNQSITLALGHGTFQDNRFISASSVTAQVDVANSAAAPGDIAIVALAVAVVVSAARSTKKETVITNPIASASRVRLGPVGVDDTKGRNLGPGETAILSGSMAWYAYNPHATTAVTLEILEMDKL